MRVIEISGKSGPGTILRFQEIPDDWTVRGGVVLGKLGHRAFPANTRWYLAPQGAKEGDTYDPATGEVTPDVPPLENVRQRKMAQTVVEASRRRVLVVEVVSPGGLNDFVSLLATSMAMLWRAVKDESSAGEVDRLNALEKEADKLIAIDQARDTILAELRTDPNPRTYDVPNSPHWPVFPDA